MAAKRERTPPKSPVIYPWGRRLANFVSQRMQKSKAPAVSIALLSDDRIAYSRGFGYRDTEKLLPSDGDTLYGIGSVTKSFTSLAVLQLQERGLLQIHDKVGKFLPEFGIGSPMAEVEIHHLMNHSSGLPTLNVAEITLMRQFGSDTSFVPMASYGDFVEFINSASGERIAPPGRKFLYWNEGYTMLGKIIETVSHQKYSDYVGTHILKPLGMERSGFGEEAVSGDGNAATFYLPSPDGKHKPTPLRSQEFDIAAGGLISSPNELCKYLRMMHGGGALGSRRIVSSALLKHAITGTVVDDRRGEFGETFYGYGWSVADDFLGHTLISHGGDVGISSAYVGFVPDSGIGVAVTSNIGGGPNSAIGGYALACLLGGDPDRDIKSIAGEALAERVRGEYTDYRGYTTLTVTEWGAGYLKAEFKSNEMSYSMPIIAEGTELYTITNYHRSPVGVRMLADGGVELLLERHRFIRR